MPGQNWDQKFDTNPISSLRGNDLLYALRQGTPNTDAVGEWGILSRYQNILVITNNGDDTNGNGSNLCPFASGTAVESFILTQSPSVTNTFFIYDQRVGTVNEDVKLIPFVTRLNNGTVDLNGNIELDSSLGSVAADTFSILCGYKSIGFGGSSILTLDFSGFPVTYNITIDLMDSNRVLFDTSALIGKSDSQGCNKFNVNFWSFNTSGFLNDGTPFVSDINVSKGIRWNTYNCFNQLSSITKDTVANGTDTIISMYDSLGFNGAPETFLTTITNTGGNNTQQIVWIGQGGVVSFVDLFFVNFPATGSNPSFSFDATWQYFIDTLDPAGDQPTFNMLTNSAFIQSSEIPLNFIPTQFSGDGGNVSARSVDGYLNGIDLALATATTIIGANFKIPDYPVTTNNTPPLNRVWIIASFPSVPITITMPDNPIRSETHTFICVNGGQDVTLNSNGFPFQGSLLVNTAGIANVVTVTAATTIHLATPAATNQSVTVSCTGVNYTPTAGIGFTT